MNRRIAVIGRASYVGLLGALIGIIGVGAVVNEVPLGLLVLPLGVIPLVGLLLARRSLVSAIPDLVFGAIDTGLLVIPAMWGGLAFGVAGAIAGGVIGDAITDSIAGFFEGGIAQWLRSKGIEESREPITSGLGKMGGCLLGSGFVLFVAFLAGIQPKFH